YPAVAQAILDESVTADPLGALVASTAMIAADAPLTAAALEAVATAADNEAAGLTPFASPSFPIAQAGGPYSGGTGTPIAFDAGATTDPDTATNSLTFRWDMN